MLLYIVRHGLPFYSPVERLTETGWKQARAIVPRMVQSGITKIYASPMRRAYETALPTAQALGLDIQIEPWTSENLAWSRFAKKNPDGRVTWVWTTDDAGAFVRGENHDAGEKWYELEAMKDIFNGKEGYAALKNESDEFLARQGYVREGNEYRIVAPSNERIAVFCHQGFGLSWLSHLLRIPPNIFWPEFDITHTGVTIVEFKNTQNALTVPKCLCLSDMSHIFASPECDYTYQTRMQI